MSTDRFPAPEPPKDRTSGPPVAPSAVHPTEREGRRVSPPTQRPPGVPRFRGVSVPRIDRSIVMTVPPVLILALITVALANPDGTAWAIGRLRTWVTSGFTWHFVIYSLVAVAVCTWLCVSRVHRVRIGGPDAKPEYGLFSWYSMLFACGQGIGLIFWGIAEPIMLRDETPVIPQNGNSGEGGIVWTYFHWGLTAWAMYCVVAICLAYSHHNLGKTLTFREAIVDILPKKSRRPAGVAIELLTIMATVLGLATSFGFAALQISSGIESFSGLESEPVVWVTVIVTLVTLTAISVFNGVSRGMKRISQINSTLSIVLVAAVFLFGPTLYIIANLSQTFGSYFQNFLSLSFWSESQMAGVSLDSWQDSWSGLWTVFIWCWVIAFSPFVAGFIARVSRGRTIREFVLGVTVVPSLIVMVWVGIIGSAGIHYDDASGRSISDDVETDSAQGLFSVLDMIPMVSWPLLVIATLLVATYYVTSLDSGSYALAEFVSAPRGSGAFFRVMLVVSIATVAMLLLYIGGETVVDTVQTGTIIGAFPFSFIILLMVVNLIRRLRGRDESVERLEAEVNAPDHRSDDDVQNKAVEDNTVR
ncbi:glycine/betaine ABC transporter permease [Nocardiopsis kunsanensis]|uniref:Glycine/betaine ABC transporter permease n=2 Tax=Nocardiopsis kunsanensis TaxID=141693 RepID=A0A918XL59_9ACTN|nr:glycine/betaine ABC transporter permease [Nocardiopsis kunsanensis]